MALIDIHHAFVTFGDSQQKEFTVQFRVTAVQAAAYFTAITQILKDATNIGLALVGIEGLAEGTMRSKGVKLETFDDAAGFPAANDNVYGFDKLQVSFDAAGNAYNLSIPTRDDAVYIVGTDGVTVDLTTPAATVDFITAINAVWLSKYGVAGAVSEITVSS